VDQPEPPDAKDSQVHPSQLRDRRGELERIGDVAHDQDAIVERVWESGEYDGFRTDGVGDPLSVEDARNNEPEQDRRGGKEGLPEANPALLESHVDHDDAQESETFGARAAGDPGENDGGPAPLIYKAGQAERDQKREEGRLHSRQARYDGLGGERDEQGGKTASQIWPNLLSDGEQEHGADEI